VRLSPDQVQALDDLMEAYGREVASGTEHSPEATSIGFQYEVAKAQVRWASISAMISASGVIVAIAAVVVAALNG
jgi:hypothetical protein